MERDVLIELAMATNIQGWARRANWLNNGSVCDWELVGCNAQGHVKLLTLDFNNLTVMHHIAILCARLTVISALDSLVLTFSGPLAVGLFAREPRQPRSPRGSRPRVQLPLGHGAVLARQPDITAPAGLGRQHVYGCDGGHAMFLSTRPDRREQWAEEALRPFGEQLLVPAAMHASHGRHVPSELRLGRLPLLVASARRKSVWGRGGGVLANFVGYRDVSILFFESQVPRSAVPLAACSSRARPRASSKPAP